MTATAGLDAHVLATRGSRSFDLEVAGAPGEVIGILGPNGAGKTTLLRALAGLLPLSGGHVVLDGRTLDDPAAGVFVAPERRAIGFVFQDYLLFPHLSVIDNVAFGLRSDGASRSLARRDALPLLERLGIADLADRRPMALSGGQAQRVALARALARTPGLLLLDEPLAALDASTRLEVRAGLREHLIGFGGPSLVVTHDVLEAMVLADRLIVIEGGRVVQHGSTGDVVSRPVTEFLARMVGVNLLRGRVCARGELALDAGGVLALGSRDVSGRTLVAVRPDAITVSREDPQRAGNCWEGTVAGLELQGSEVQVTVEGAPPVRVVVSPARVGELHLGFGEVVWLSVDPADLVVYPETEPASAGTEL